MQHNVYLPSTHIKTMKYLCSIGAFIFALLLTGCGSAPLQPIALDQASSSLSNSRVGVVLSEMPKPNTFFPGASCLLCAAAAEITNNKLTTYTKTLPVNDLIKVKSELVELLKAKGASMVELPANFSMNSLPDANKKEADTPNKDFSSVRSQYKLDKLVVINITLMGMQRNYSAYIPSGAPAAKVQGLAYLVDLPTNKYQWYLPIDIQKGTEGEWDEPSQFPGLTNAYYQAIELSKDAVLAPFKAK
jgi:hypothetical protein